MNIFGKKWDPLKIIKESEKIKSLVSKQHTNDLGTKAHTVSMFNYIQELADYRVPRPPINVSEDRKHFTCVKCGIFFDTIDDTVDDFDICPICGQVWNDPEKKIKLIKKNATA